jgi:hypothetical protein
VAFDDSNILDHANNVSAAANWRTQPLAFIWNRFFCGQAYAGYEILQGNYGLNNFTQGAPLTLYASPAVGCPASPPIQYFIFMPLSDRVSAHDTRGGLSNFTLGSSLFPDLGVVSGHWTGTTEQTHAGQVFGGLCPGTSSYGCPLTFNPFDLGTYTVVAADEWGQLCLLHFQVDARTSPQP